MYGLGGFCNVVRMVSVIFLVKHYAGDVHQKSMFSTNEGTRIPVRTWAFHGVFCSPG